MPKTLNVGIDIGQDSHAVCLLDESGARVGRTFAIANSPQGAAGLVERLARAAGGYEGLQLGMEATGIYWWHLYRALARASELAPYEPRLVVFNPRLIKGFREACKAMDKTDPDDAFLIAERLRFGRLPDYPPPDPCYFPLQRLTRCRHHLVDSLVRTKCYALDLLFLAASEYERLKPFSECFGATSMAVLGEFEGLDELAAVPLEELSAFIARRGRNAFPDPDEPARLLKQVAADSFRLDEEAAQAVHFALKACLGQIDSLTKSLGPLDRRIAKELERFPNTLLTVPGIGPVYAAGLVAEVGDVHRFADDDALAKQAGLWWPRRQSGKFESEDRPLSKAGNAYLRYYLCEAANSLRGHNEEYRRYYERKYREATRHHHRRAIVLTARKLVRLVYALLSTGQIYAGLGAVSPHKPKARR